MTDFLDRWAQSSDANARLLAQEILITEATEALWAALEQAGVSKSELAERLGTTKGYVSQVFSGSRNMTIRTLSDICFALKVKPTFRIEREAVDDVTDGGWNAVEDVPVAVVGVHRRHLYLVRENGSPVACDWQEAA